MMYEECGPNELAASEILGNPTVLARYELENIDLTRPFCLSPVVSLTRRELTHSLKHRSVDKDLGDYQLQFTTEDIWKPLNRHQ